MSLSGLVIRAAVTFASNPWVNPWNGLVKMHIHNHWLFILRKEMVVVLYCSDGRGEDRFLNGTAVLVLGERCILKVDDYRLTSQDAIKKEVTVQTGQSSDKVQSEGIRDIVLIKRSHYTYWEQPD